MNQAEKAQLWRDQADEAFRQARHTATRLAAGYDGQPTSSAALVSIALSLSVIANVLTAAVEEEESRYGRASGGPEAGR